MTTIHAETFEVNPDYPKLRTRLVVGLEIHVELATRSKMWTSAPNVAHRDRFDAEPNSLIDPVVAGMPGTLPVINEQALEMSIRVGLALGCHINQFTKWDRKSYYYPDLPKNYQISQYDLPVCGDGALDIPVSGEGEGKLLDGAMKRIGIVRAHLEEDAGKLLHEAPAGGAGGVGGVGGDGEYVGGDFTIVDLNRAGTPLLEIVTQPDFSTPDEVVMFGQVLRQICRHLGVSEGIMQKGHMRFEPNINVVIDKDGELFKTPIVEIKNLNSFKAVHGAITHEYRRQVDEWVKTGVVMGARAKSTRGWDDVKLVTTHQRHKEDADEYRYFPDPDLVPAVISDEWIARLQAGLPELPLAKEKRYCGELGLDGKVVDALLDDPRLTAFFEEVLETGAKPQSAAAVLLNYGAKRANELGVSIAEVGASAEQVRDIIALADADKVGSSAADKLFGYCCESDEPAEKLAEQHGLLQVSDTGALEGYIDEVLANPKMAKAVEDIRGGKDKAIGALMGQVMRLSGGSANPKVVTEMIKKKILG